MTKECEATTPTIVRAIVEARKRQGLSGPDLAQRTGGVVSHSTLANLETGRKRIISVDEVITLARALGLPPIALLYPRPFDTEEAVLDFTGYNGDDSNPYPGFWDCLHFTTLASTYDQDGNKEAAAMARANARRAREFANGTA
jgi:transcriptional regulator with XRE-family HTH domain